MRRSTAGKPGVSADAEVVRRWVEFVEGSPAALTERWGMAAGESPEGLVPLWLAVRGVLDQRAAGLPVPDQDALDDLTDLVSAHVGRLLLRQVPGARWEVLRITGVVGYGTVVLVLGTDPAGGDPTWVSPVQVVAGTMIQYLRPPGPGAAMSAEQRADPAVLLTGYRRLERELMGYAGLAVAPPANPTQGAGDGGLSTWRPDGSGRRVPLDLAHTVRKRGLLGREHRVQVVVPEFAEAVLGQETFDALPRIAAGVEGVEAVSDDHDREELLLQVSPSAARDLPGLLVRLQDAVDRVTPPATDPVWSDIPHRWN